MQKILVRNLRYPGNIGIQEIQGKNFPDSKFPTAYFQTRPAILASLNICLQLLGCYLATLQRFWPRLSNASEEGASKTCFQQEIKNEHQTSVTRWEWLWFYLFCFTGRTSYVQKIKTRQRSFKISSFLEQGSLGPKICPCLVSPGVIGQLGSSLFKLISMG